MACSSHGSNLILVLADGAVTAFESVTAVLQTAGNISATEATALKGYVGEATTVLDGVVADLKNGTTVSKIAATVQTLVAAYNTVGASLTPGIAIWVNVANAGLQSLLAALGAEQATQAAATPATTAHALLAQTAVEKPVHEGLLDAFKIHSLQSRMAKVHAAVNALVPVA